MSEPKTDPVLTGFTGYTYEPPKKKVGGKQKKWAGSGKYIEQSNNQDKKEYFIKSSLYNSADDIAEVVSSALMNDLIRDNPLDPNDHYANTIVQYDFIKNKENQHNYVKSQIASGYKYELGDKVTHYPGTSNVLGKDGLYNLLKENDKKDDKEKDTARFLAVSLLLSNYDCHPGNLFMYQQKNGDERIGGYDFGWSMADILRGKEKQVHLLHKKTMRSQKGTHAFGGTPTNHFNDYPNIIQSKYFVNALEKVAKHSEERLNASIDAALEKIDNAHYSKTENGKKIFDEKERKKAYSSFFHHLKGGKKPEETSDETAEKLKTELSNALKTRLAERTQSMYLTASLIDVRLKYKEINAIKSKEIPKRKTEIKTSIETNLSKMLRVVRDKCLKDPVDNKKVDSKKVEDIFPYFRRKKQTFGMSEEENLTYKIQKMLDFAKEHKIEINSELETVCRKINTKTSVLTYEEVDKALKSFEKSLTSAQSFEQSPVLPKLTSMFSMQQSSNQTISSEASNVQHQSLESLTKTILESSSKLFSLKNAEATSDKENNIVKLKIDDEKEPRVSIHSSDTAQFLSIRELPLSPVIKSDQKLEHQQKNIELIVCSLLAVGDPNPKILNGSPEKVLSLLEALSKHPEVFKNPQISEDILKRINDNTQYQDRYKTLMNTWKSVDETSKSVDETSKNEPKNLNPSH